MFVKDDLKAGSFVRASYTTEGNENVVTSIMIRNPFQGGSSVSR